MQLKSSERQTGTIITRRGRINEAGGKVDVQVDMVVAGPGEIFLLAVLRSLAKEDKEG